MAVIIKTATEMFTYPTAKLVQYKWAVDEHKVDLMFIEPTDEIWQSHKVVESVSVMKPPAHVLVASARLIHWFAWEYVASASVESDGEFCVRYGFRRHLHLPRAAQFRNGESAHLCIGSEVVSLRRDVEVCDGQDGGNTLDCNQS